MYASVRELDFDQARDGLTVRFWDRSPQSNMVRAQ